MRDFRIGTSGLAQDAGGVSHFDNEIDSAAPADADQLIGLVGKA